MFGLKRFRVRTNFNEIIKPGLERIFEDIEAINVQQQFTTSLKDFLVLCEVIWRRRVEDPEAVLNGLVKGLPWFDEMIVISSDRNRTLGFVKGVYDELFTQLFTFTTREFMCFIEYPITVRRDFGVFSLIGPPKEVKRLVDYVADWGTPLEIMAITEYHTRDRGLLTVLTDKQLSVLRQAHRMGFFDHPRRADARKVAGKLGMRHTTFLTHIRKAQGRMLDELFGE